MPSTTEAMSRPMSRNWIDERNQRAGEIKTGRIYGALLNGSGDIFIKRLRSPKRIQQLGIFTIGLFFAGTGLAIVAEVWSAESVAGILVGLACFALGLKLFINGFKSRRG
jgi:hypothetical protein